MKFTFDTKVRGYELDSYGHLNNAVYLSYTEQARWEILENRGLLQSFLDSNLLLVVTETNIRYMRELKLSDKVGIETRVKYNSPYLIFYHDIFNRSNDLKAAKVEVKTLLIDKDRIPQDIPESLLEIAK